MPSLTISQSDGKGEAIKVHVNFDQTTLLDLRYQLFSLTDIPPHLFIIYTSSSKFLPNDAIDTLKTLTSAGIDSTSKLFYEIIEDQSSTTTEANATTSVENPPSDVTNLTNIFQQSSALGADSASSSETQPSSTERPSAQPSPSRPSASKPTSVQTSHHVPIYNSASFIEQVRRYRKSVLAYENLELQAKALKVVPLTSLQQKARKRQEEDPIFPTYEKALSKELLIWFKDDFFTWINAPACWSCGKEMTALGMTPPSSTELKYGGNRVELYQCNRCSATTRFPRYNDAAKLLETRKGRCGEWAQAFTLIARAVGLRARVVHDWTDHVWTEIHCPDTKESQTGSWLHADSCENVLDEPLLYEKGWGKKLNYCVATGVDSVMDVTRRYCEDFDALCVRRTLVDEGYLDMELKRMNREAVLSIPVAEREGALSRYERDAADVGSPGSHDAALPGRQSGSAAWVRSRGEDGSSR